MYSSRSNVPDPTSRSGPTGARSPDGSLVALAAPVLLALAAAVPLSAQERVAGEVVDASTLEPLAGVQVTVEGTRIGAVTDESGGFELTGLAGEEATLQVRYLGCQPVTRTVAVGATDVSIRLEVDAITLDEIVATGTAGGASTTRRRAPARPSRERSGTPGPPASTS